MDTRGGNDPHLLILLICILIVELVELKIDDFSLLLIIIDISVFLIHSVRRRSTLCLSRSRRRPSQSIFVE